MSIVLKVMSVIKGREIVLDEDVSILYLHHLFLIKTLALLRGILIARQCVFIGRGTTIMCPKRLFAAKGVEIGPYCQIDCLSRGGLYVGRSSKIGAFSTIKVSGSLADLGKKIVLGDNVGIGEYAHIGGAADVIIGDDTIAGAYLSIHPENHQFNDIDKPIRLQGVTRQGIHVGRNCWIGAKVTILDGAKIGDGCVVAAGSVVRGEFPDNVVLGGVPARVLKRR